MSDILLSILIPYTLDRQSEYDKLYNRLLSLGINTDKYKGIVEEISDFADKSMTIGEKRERMYAYCNGRFAWQIDCDDDISDDAIEKILKVIKSNPEIPCITFREKCIINDKYYSSNHSIKYDKWQDNFDGYDYVRSPFYKDVIRTDLAKSVPFERIRWNEDERWSYAIKPLLTDEIHLDEEIYYYIHNSSDPTERYGLDKD